MQHQKIILSFLRTTMEYVKFGGEQFTHQSPGNLQSWFCKDLGILAILLKKHYF